jgi:hypothetical protein
LEPTRSNGHPPLAVVFPVVSIYYQKSHQPKWIHSRADSAHFSGNPSHGMECVLRFQPHFRPIRFLATTECVSNANRGPSPSSLRNYVEPLYQANAGRCSGSTMRCLDFNVLKRPRLLVFSKWVGEVLRRLASQVDVTTCISRQPKARLAHFQCFQASTTEWTYFS